MATARVLGLAAVLGAVLWLLVGCGGGSEDPGPTAGAATATAVTIDADSSGRLRWVQPRAEAKAGRVRVTLRNGSGMANDLHLTGNGVDATTPTFQERSASIIVTLKPGTYTYRCEVPGHEAMTGTLTAK